MVPSRSEFLEPERRKMKVATDGTRDRLCLIVIVKAGQVAPAWGAAQLDQTRADHDTKTKPAKEPYNQHRRPALEKRTAIDQRAKKDRQKAGLEQLNLPTVTVPDLSNVYDRHVHRPKDAKKNCIGVAAKNNQRQTDTNPRENRQSIIGNAEPKERRYSQHRGSGRTELALDALEKTINRR